MKARDDLVRAACMAGADAPTIVRVHRLAPLVEYAVELQQAADSEAVLEAVVDERTALLLDELLIARRRALLAEARLAALEAAS